MNAPSLFLPWINSTSSCLMAQRLRHHYNTKEPYSRAGMISFSPLRWSFMLCYNVVYPARIRSFESSVDLEKVVHAFYLLTVRLLSALSSVRRRPSPASSWYEMQLWAFFCFIVFLYYTSHCPCLPSLWELLKIQIFEVFNTQKKSITFMFCLLLISHLLSFMILYDRCTSLCFVWRKSNISRFIVIIRKSVTHCLKLNLTSPVLCT